jgi:ketosteroid isomerase-like protein
MGCQLRIPIKHWLVDLNERGRPIFVFMLQRRELSMSLQLRITLVTIGLALLMSSAHVSAARAQQKVLTNEQTQIVDTVNTMFTALQTDDAAKLNSIIAPDFYIFDGGRRFNGEAIMAQIKALKAAGKCYEWNVTEPDVRISGNTAWIAYVNDGSIADASGRVNQQWLESAFLEKEAGIWKILFMHSTRVHQITEEEKMDQTSINREFVKRHFEAVNRRNIQTVLGNMRPDLYDHELQGDHKNDLQEGAQRLQVLMKQVPDLAVDVRDVIADGDKVVVRAVWLGTDAVSQRKVEFHGFVQWRIVEGKFAERWATVTPLAELPEGVNAW